MKLGILLCNEELLIKYIYIYISAARVLSIEAEINVMIREDLYVKNFYCCQIFS